MIIFDPIQEYLGYDINGRPIDINSMSAVRPKLAKLAAMAAENDVAVVAIAHNNKKTEQSAVHRVSGTTDLVNAARSVLSIVIDPEDPLSRLAIHTKHNRGEGKTIRYRIDTMQNEAGGMDARCTFVALEAYTEKDYIKACRAAAKAPSAIEEAVDYETHPIIVTVRRILKDNPTKDKIHLSWDTLAEACRRVVGAAPFGSWQTGKPIIERLSKDCQVHDQISLYIPDQAQRPTRITLRGEPLLPPSDASVRGVTIMRSYHAPQQESI